MGGVGRCLAGLYLAAAKWAVLSQHLGRLTLKRCAKAQRSLSAAAQPLIDDAIETASGAGWKTTEYGRRHENIERQQFQRELAKLPEARFAKVMKGEDPDFVESKLGPGR